MIYGIQRIAKYLLGTDIAGRSLAVRRDDTFLVSYPRSGNTWTRFLVGNLMHPNEPVNFATIETLIPDAEAQSSRYLKRMSSPRFIKSHQYFDHRYPKVLYIVRDPRDVVLSYYDFSRKYRQIDDDYPLQAYVSDFVNARLSSASWGTWGENVGTWIAARQGRPGFMLVRYEDLKTNAAAELARMAGFLDLEPSPELIARALQQSSAEEMRKMEKTQSNDWVATKDKRTDVPFVGAAQAGKWRAKLPPSAIAEVEAAWGSLMVSLGYELTQSKADVPGSVASTSSVGRKFEAAPVSMR